MSSFSSIFRRLLTRVRNPIPFDLDLEEDWIAWDRCWRKHLSFALSDPKGIAEMLEDFSSIVTPRLL